MFVNYLLEIIFRVHKNEPDTSSKELLQFKIYRHISGKINSIIHCAVEVYCIPTLNKHVKFNREKLANRISVITLHKQILGVNRITGT